MNNVFALSATVFHTLFMDIEHNITVRKYVVFVRTHSAFSVAKSGIYIFVFILYQTLSGDPENM